MQDEQDNQNDVDLNGPSLPEEEREELQQTLAEEDGGSSEDSDSSGDEGSSGDDAGSTDGSLDNNDDTEGRTA